MGAALFVSLEKESPDDYSCEVNGKALAKTVGVLDAFAEKSGWTPLMKFFSVSPEEVRELMELDETEAASLESAEHWFLPADGLIPVQSLLAHLNEHPGFVKNSESVIEDLTAIEKVLKKAEENQVRFHFSLDI